MFEFEWPWLLLLLPLPLLVRLLPPLRSPLSIGDAALRVPFFDRLVDLPGVEGRLAGDAPAESRGRVWLLALAWLLLLLAAARPVWLGAPIALPQEGRDLMLAVDISESMQTADFELQGTRVDRLTAVKAVAGEFISGREGDRLGLILFATRAYLQVPLTFDRATVRALLEESVIGLAGKTTAIGDAIGLAVKRLRDRPPAGRVLILLSDGANTAGAVSPLQAAELAATAGVRIHTIGIGAELMEIPTLFGKRQVNPSADLDEETLTAIAEQSGGRYFRATDVEELWQIYRLIDELEPVPDEAGFYRPRQALFHWPLAAALLVGLLILLPTLRYGGRGRGGV